MGPVKAVKGINRMTGRSKEKEEEKELEQTSRGQEKSENEKTLSKVFKAIGKVIATVTAWLVQALWPVFLVILVVCVVGALFSAFIELFNWETDKDTDTAVINAATIIDAAISDEEFVNEILDMINRNVDMNEIYDKIKDRLIDGGMDENDAEMYQERVLKTIQKYGQNDGEGSSTETSSVIKECYGYLIFA